MKNDVVHTAQAAVEHGGHATDWLRVQDAIADDADATSAFGNEDAAVG
jgi:hypothetical protein